jgi:hypothetical protein
MGEDAPNALHKPIMSAIQRDAHDRVSPLGRDAGGHIENRQGHDGKRTITLTEALTARITLGRGGSSRGAIPLRGLSSISTTLPGR